MLPLLGGLIVFVVLGLALIAERSFEGGRRLPRPRRRTPALPPAERAKDAGRLPR